MVPYMEYQGFRGTPNSSLFRSICPYPPENERKIRKVPK
jgi:hypothetical protein